MYGFGDFRILCNNADIPLCSLVGPYDGEGVNLFGVGIAPKCYARSVDLANTMVFNIGNVFLELGMLLVISLIIFNSYQKYTAVGRREMLDIQYTYMFLTIWSLVVDSGVTPTTSGSFPYFAAIQAGIASGLIVLLVAFGLLGFQFWEDGTKRSVWGARLIATLWGALVFVISLLTFKGWTSAFSPVKTEALMGMLYVGNLALLVFYVCETLWLTTVVLHDWWAMGAQLMGVFLFVAGQVLMYVFGSLICDRTKHYVDGMFFATACNGLAMLMIYKSWDIITSEDLEFSVSSQAHTWDLKSAEDIVDAESEYALSNYQHQSPYL